MEPKQTLPQKPIDNPVKNWWKNLKNTKQNYKKVRASPYASLKIALKVRQIVVWIIIPILVYMTYSLVKHAPKNGMMTTITNLFTICIMGYVCWMIYKTIPAAKAQIDYYKKYPHLINYAPTNTKETIDEILAKIQQNKEKEVEKQDVRQKKATSSSPAYSEGYRRSETNSPRGGRKYPRTAPNGK